jgi:hypothetical protein
METGQKVITKLTLKISNLVGIAKYYLILKDYSLDYSINPDNHERNNRISSCRLRLISSNFA